MALLSGGGWAQYCRVHKGSILEIPVELSMEEGAAIMEQWCTAYQLLHKVAHVEKGDTVLIHAAASGVGTALIQLCNVAGAKSIAVSSTETKLAACAQLGSFATINYKDHPDFSSLVLEHTGGKGANVILDPVMGQNFNYNLDSIAMDSRWVLYGSLGGVMIQEANIMKLMKKRGSLLSTTLRTRSDEYKSDLVSSLGKDCLPLFKSKSLVPKIDKQFTFSSAGEAFQYMENNLNLGKIVIMNDL